MISITLISFQVVLGLIAIGTGATVLFGLLTGELLDRWTVNFLRCSLAASVIGLFFPFHPFEHLTPTQEIFMLSVYVAGAEILAWRKYRLAGVWRSIFALTTTVVLYLNVAVAITQVFKHISQIMAWAPAQSQSTFLVTQLLVTAVFVVLGILAVKRFQVKPIHKAIHSF